MYNNSDSLKCFLAHFLKQNKTGEGFYTEMGKSIKSQNQRYTRDAFIKERFKLRNKIDRVVEIPFAILGLIWFNLLIFYMLYEQSGFLESVSAIWILFQSELLLKIYLSPSARIYFKRNPVVAASAIFPVVRVLRLYRYILSSGQRIKKYQQKVFNS
jgi:hypothetical protein